MLSLPAVFYLLYIFNCRSTLYVGEHPFGLYALPSLVDQSVATVDHLKFGALLIEGPHEAPSNLDDSAHDTGKQGPRNVPSNSLDNLLLSNREMDVSPSYPLIILGNNCSFSSSSGIVRAHC